MGLTLAKGAALFAATAAWLTLTAPAAEAQSCPGRRSGSFNARILGGEPADIRNWPGMIVMRTKRDYGGVNGLNVENHYFCGGTLIDKRWVLTAAHCVYGTRPGITDFVKVAGGRWVAGPNTAYVENTPLEIFENTSNLSSLGAPLIPERVIYHAGYDPLTFKDDIALIKLKAPAKGPTMKIAAAAAADPGAANGLDTWTAGFGKVSNSHTLNALTQNGQRIGTGGSPLLQEVSLPMRTNSQECIDGNPGFPFVGAKQLCVGIMKQDPQRPKDSCSGDSGGPLARLGGDNCPIQVGLVSFGPETCAENNRPAVYTRVSAYNGWIRKVVGQDTLLAEVRDGGGAVPIPAMTQAMNAIAPRNSGGRSDSSGPRVAVALSGNGPVKLGTDREITVSALGVSGYVIVGDVDAAGALTYLAPNNFDPEPKLLQAGQSLTFGTVDQPYRLKAQPPLGKGFVFAIITPDRSLSDRLRLSQRARAASRGFVAAERQAAEDEFTSIAETVARQRALPGNQNRFAVGRAEYTIVP